jgi:hypothetical protein
MEPELTFPSSTSRTSAELAIDAFMNPSAEAKKEEEDAMRAVDPYTAWEAASLEGGVMALRGPSSTP